MPRKQFMIQANVREDLKNQFEEIFEESGTNSRGEFINVLLDNYVNPQTQVKEVVKEVPVEKEVEVIKEVPVEKEVVKEIIKEVPMSPDENQIIVELNPVQKALLNRIVSDEGVINTYSLPDNNEEVSSEFLEYKKKWGEKLLEPLSRENPSENSAKLLKNLFFEVLTMLGVERISPGLELSKSEIRQIIAENDPEYDVEAAKGFWESIFS